MRVFLILSLFLDGQSITISGGRQSIIVSGNGPPAAVVETRIPEPVIEHPAPAVPQEPSPVEVPKRSRRYLAMFTASWCGPCQGWKRSVKPQVEAAGYHVAMIEMTDPAKQRKYSRRIGRYPSFVVCDWETGAWLSDPIVGAIDLVTAKQLLGATDTKQTSPVRSIHPEAAGRYVVYGNTTYDMETWGRMCSLRSCGMCNYLDSKQAEYFANKAALNSPQSSSSPDVVDEGVEVMQLTSDDVVGELGCGDGNAAIQMVQRSGCRVVGVEIDRAKVDEALANVAAAGLQNRITIIHGDVMDFDPKSHRITKAYCYLYPELLERLAPRIRSIPVVVSAGHKIPGLGGQVQNGQFWVYRSESIQ